jgi:hypothetical protein
MTFILVRLSVPLILAPRDLGPTGRSWTEILHHKHLTVSTKDRCFGNIADIVGPI